VVRHGDTSERDVGIQVIPLANFMSWSPHEEGCNERAQVSIASHGTGIRRCNRWVKYDTSWRFAFEQSGPCHITRVLQNGTLSVFEWLPLFQQALVPSDFQLQVGWMAQECPF
jgi:hypothetical protein